MKIIINNNEVEVDTDTSLESLIESHIQSTNGIAVAVNEKVIKKEGWTDYILKGNDKILIIKAAYGG